jgi:hypothetical protein
LVLTSSGASAVEIQIDVGRQQGPRALHNVYHVPAFPGVTDTPRKTNYGFERRERERSKAADNAKKAQAKADKKASEQKTPEVNDTSDP